jgi:hypothetical protein
MQQVHCNACGNKIEVPSTARYITCARCGASLVVRHEGGAWFTESPPEPRRGNVDDDHGPMREVAGRLAELERQSEIDRLDREWQTERETYMMTGRYGYRSLPSAGTALLTGIIAVVGGGLWTAFAFFLTSGMTGAGAPAPIGIIFPCFGVFFILVGLGFAFYQYSRAQQYEEALARYQRRRRELLDGGPRRDDGGARF